MNYTKIDPDAVGAEQLHNQAVNAEATAYQAECQEEELNALARLFPEYAEPAEAAAGEASRLRNEANVLVKAAGLSKKDIEPIHINFLEQWITSTEMNHAGHAAVAKVRASGKLPDAGHEAVMERLEIAHQIATERLAKKASAKK